MTSPPSKDRTFNFRILFGPLFGTDLLIAGAEVFFYVGDNTIENAANAGESTPAQASHALAHANNTLYIPYRADQPNFRLRIGKTSGNGNDTQDREPSLGSTGDGDFEVDFLHPDTSETQSGTFNAVCRHGDIAFAIKREDEAWSETVLTYAQAASSNTIVALRDSASGTRGAWLPKVLAVCSVTLLIGGGAVLGLRVLRHHTDAQRVANISELLAPAPAPNVILNGASGEVYVLSASQDGAEWDRQVLLKAAPPERVQVATLDGERQRLESSLDKAGADFITVRLANPARPTLVVRANVSPESRDAAVHEVQRAAPYAAQVQVTYANVETMLREARNGLDKVGVPYRQIARPNGTTFQVADSLGDEELSAVRNLIVSYGQKWGARCVNFKVELRTDWLKDKSYREGQNGYVLLQRNTWYFSNLIAGEH